MIVNLILLEYNNEFNGEIIKYDTISEYIDNHPAFLVESVNDFNPNDGINTVYQAVNDCNINPDYLVVTDAESGNHEIISRWFVKPVYVREGQISLELKRDAVADNYDVVMHSPCFIEKGFLNDSNPLIYKKEPDFSSDERPIADELIYDDTGCDWITVYYDKTKKSSLQGEAKIRAGSYDMTISTPITEWPFYQTFNNQNYIHHSHSSLNLHYRLQWYGDYPQVNECVVNIPYMYPLEQLGYKTAESIFYDTTKDTDTFYYGTAKSPYPNFSGDKEYRPSINWSDMLLFADRDLHFMQELDESLTDTGNYNISNVLSYSEKVIKDSNGRLTRIKITDVSGDGRIEAALPSDIELDLSTYMQNYFDPYVNNGLNKDRVHTSLLYIEEHVKKYRIEFIDVTAGQTISFNFSDAADVNDQPFGLLLLPNKFYIEQEDITFDCKVSGTSYSNNHVIQGLGMAIAQALAEKGSGASSIVYDVQQLPYCPIYIPTTATHKLELDKIDQGLYKAITVGTGAQIRCVGFVIYPVAANFTKTINISNRLYGAIVPDDNVKLENQCSFYRLNSPNWNGYFQFTVPMIGYENLNTIEIKCAYKPYNPFILVRPLLGNTYGDTENTAMGLICGGDFSVTTLTDQWQKYQIENKTYAQQFSREVQHVQTTFEANKDSRWLNFGTDTMAGIGKGALAGAMAGAASGSSLGPYGAIAGAAIGLGSGIVKGLGNMNKEEKLHREEVSYMKDMHNYQLQNIKALPNVITKVDAFNPSNRRFPVLQRYSCPQEQKDAFLEKLKYEGMTVGVIGQIANYLDPNNKTFIKGQFIKLNNLKGDSRMANAIYEQIAKGVYL